MLPLLYTNLVPWYRLIDPYADHLDEATCYLQALDGAATPRAETLLDLGAGAGGNVYHLKSRFRCTLVDLAQDMLALSRELNPECEHVLGDMRTVRLGREYDAVLVHDAIMYMTTEEELRAAIETAAIHTRSGGAAVFAPDTFADTFEEACVLLEHEEEGRAMRGMEWSWDPDPSDSMVSVEYSFLLRDENGHVQSVHDRHIEGLFSIATWRRLLEGAGYSVEMIPRPLDDEGEFDEIFLCRKR